MRLSFDVRIPDGLLAANALLNEKPHQGVASWNLALHPGIDERNSTAAIGIRASEHLNRIWPRYTGKERDTESGLDYFGARYYGSSMGRWMSPDPVSISMLRLVNPQRLNKYAYAVNKPLTYVDTDGREPVHFMVVADIPSRMRYLPVPAMGGTKLVHTFTVETDPSKSPKVDGGESIFVGPSHGVGITSGGSPGTPACMGWCEGQAPADKVGAAVGRNPNGDIEVDLKDDVSYPLVPGSPDIDIEMTIILKKMEQYFIQARQLNFLGSQYLNRIAGVIGIRYLSNPWAKAFYYRSPIFLFAPEPTFKVTSGIIP